jgi:hypothetical protein
MVEKPLIYAILFRSALLLVGIKTAKNFQVPLLHSRDSRQFIRNLCDRRDKTNNTDVFGLLVNVADDGIDTAALPLYHFHCSCALTECLTSAAVAALLVVVVVVNSETSSTTYFLAPEHHFA